MHDESQPVGEPTTTPGRLAPQQAADGADAANGAGQCDPVESRVLTQIVAEFKESLDKRLEDLEHRLLQDRPTFRVMLTERDVAKLIKCDVRTVRRLEKAGVLPPALRFGGSKRWRAEAIEAWFEQLAEDRPR